jgi:hypothetical protein
MQDTIILKIRTEFLDGQGRRCLISIRAGVQALIGWLVRDPVGTYSKSNRQSREVACGHQAV